MDWPSLKAAIVTALTTASGLDDIKWSNTQEAGYYRGLGNAGYVDLILRSPSAVATDAIRTEYDAGEDKLVPSVVGPRRFVVSVRITRESQLDDEETVGVLAQRMRARLKRRSIIKDLWAAGLSIATIEPTIDADVLEDNRWVSRSITDIIFLASENDTDTDDPGDYFDRVEAGPLSGSDFDGIIDDETIGPA